MCVVYGIVRKDFDFLVGQKDSYVSFDSIDQHVSRIGTFETKNDVLKPCHGDRCSRIDAIGF